MSESDRMAASRKKTVLLFSDHSLTKEDVRHELDDSEFLVAVAATIPANVRLKDGLDQGIKNCKLPMTHDDVVLIDAKLLLTRFKKNSPFNEIREEIEELGGEVPVFMLLVHETFNHRQKARENNITTMIPGDFTKELFTSEYEFERERDKQVRARYHSEEKARRKKDFWNPLQVRLLAVLGAFLLGMFVSRQPVSSNAPVKEQKDHMASSAEERPLGECVRCPAGKDGNERACLLLHNEANQDPLDIAIKAIPDIDVLRICDIQEGERVPAVPPGECCSIPFAYYWESESAKDQWEKRVREMKDRNEQHPFFIALVDPGRSPKDPFLVDLSDLLFPSGQPKIGQ